MLTRCWWNFFLPKMYRRKKTEMPLRRDWMTHVQKVVYTLIRLRRFLYLMTS